MAFQRPTLDQIVDRVRSDIKGALGIFAILRRSFLEAIAFAIAGAAHILHGHLVFVSRQIFPDQAEKEFLQRWAAIYNILQKAATFTQLTISVEFTAAGTLPATTQLQRSDGVTYTVDADITATVAGFVTGTVTCDDSGSNGNIDAGEFLSLTSPVANVNQDIEVTGFVIEGEDQETDASLQERVVARIRLAPQGGATFDYIAWAREVTGVTRAWVFPDHLGQGTVGVSFVEDENVSIIPLAPKVAEVQDHIDFVKPVTADVTVFAPIERVVNMSIKVKPNSVAIQDAITAEIVDLFQREANVAGAYKSVHEFFDGKILLSKVNEAISLAAGEDDHILLAPVEDIRPNDSEIATLGTITFSTLV